jgi:hypothetical protein
MSARSSHQHARLVRACVRPGLLAVCVLGLCGAGAAPPSLHASMKKVVAPEAQALWDISNKATDGDGEPIAGKLTAADWDKLIEGSRRLKARAGALAQARRIEVAGPGETIQDEGAPEAPTREEIQRLLDADLPAFNTFAAQLAGAADQVSSAARKKDIKAVSEVANQLDELCESCHVTFWYPKQKTE